MVAFVLGSVRVRIRVRVSFRVRVRVRVRALSRVDGCVRAWICQG